jgi:hypothetical protein
MMRQAGAVETRPPTLRTCKGAGAPIQYRAARKLGGACNGVTTEMKFKRPRPLQEWGA